MTSHISKTIIYDGYPSLIQNKHGDNRSHMCSCNLSIAYIIQIYYIEIACPWDRWGIRTWLPGFLHETAALAIDGGKCKVSTIARERGNLRDVWSAVVILWWLHFSRVRPAPARNTWHQLGPVENENIASHLHDKYYLYYSIMPKIKIYP